MKKGSISKPLANLCEVFTDGNWIESKDQSPKGIRLIQTGNVGHGVFKDRGEKARYRQSQRRKEPPKRPRPLRKPPPIRLLPARQGGVEKSLGETCKMYQPQITRTNLSPLLICYPESVREQKQLAKQFEDLTTETQRLATLYARKLAALEALKKSLLHRAFSGEL